MSGDTNLDTLVLVCDVCQYTDPAARRPWPRSWPRHCDQPMRLANTTDRNGGPIVEFPYEPELP